MKSGVNWDKYFMDEAHRASKGGKEPATQVGICIVDDNKHIVDTSYSWSLFKNNGYIAGCTTYTTLFPSIEYVKDISNSKIKEVIYLTESNRVISEAVKQKLNEAKIKYRKLKCSSNLTA